MRTSLSILVHSEVTVAVEAMDWQVLEIRGDIERIQIDVQISRDQLAFQDI